MFRLNKTDNKKLYRAKVLEFSEFSKDLKVTKEAFCSVLLSRNSVKTRKEIEMVSEISDFLKIERSHSEKMKISLVSKILKMFKFKSKRILRFLFQRYIKANKAIEVSCPMKEKNSDSILQNLLNLDRASYFNFRTYVKPDFIGFTTYSDLRNLLNTLTLMLTDSKMAFNRNKQAKESLLKGAGCGGPRQLKGDGDEAQEEDTPDEDHPGQ